MKSQDLPSLNIPDSPGVYFFKKGKEILYIGKATSLRNRTRSYFPNTDLGKKTLLQSRGPIIFDMTCQADTLTWEQTDTVLEALILEAELIKKHQPPCNKREKDNKSFNYVCITKEDFPMVLVIRGRTINQEVPDVKYQAVYGPFTNGMQLKQAMKIIRRIFPYRDAQSVKRDNEVFYHQLGLSPDTSNEHAKEIYQQTIKNLKTFFQGKKKDVIRSMKKQMIEASKKYDFERAAKLRDQIFALEHINDVALIKDDNSFHAPSTQHAFRIEAYDIAHLSGKNMVGVMTVIEDGELAKSEYRKFIINTQTDANDTGALEEVLSRRFRHTEWGLPSLIVLDGSQAQMNVAKRVLNRYQFDIPLVAVVKDDKHKAKAVIGDDIIIKTHKKSIVLANSEAHRFAITFHKLKRNKNFLV